MADEMTHFERLGLPRRFDVDAAELERLYLERGRGLHPDRHSGGSSADQLASLELSSALNEAYRVLKDPFRRADYLLRLEGGPSAADVKEMPPEFLEQILELRMEIEGVKASAEPGSPEYEAMAGRLARLRLEVMSRVGPLFAEAEAADDRAEALARVRRKLNAAKFVQGLERDLHAE